MLRLRMPFGAGCALAALLVGCSSEGGASDASSAGSDTGSDSDADTGADSDADADGDSDTPDGSDTGSATDTGEACPLTGDLGKGQHTVKIDFNGTPRSYILYVPKGYDKTAATPLVVNMHGLSETAAMEVQFSQMNATANAAGFVVAYPQGIGNSWNAGLCCGTAQSSGVDDVGFIRAVVKDAAAKACLDPKRVYATGMSNGGHMAYRLACDAADVFAAVAPVSGAKTTVTCNPSQPVPLIAYHGLQDPIVAYSLDKPSIDYWVSQNKCGKTPVTTAYGGSHCDAYSGCKDGVQVVFCTLDPEGHCWPGGSKPLCLPGFGAYNDDIDASSHMWEFMKQFSL
jgi:polyhydroxybutyrate depolymerase